MRPFLTRILVCAIPCLIAALVVGRAFHRYQSGEGGFKLGVDLVGGTILVYEIDKQRQVEGEQVADEVRQSQRLAESLKRRIDPADLYNVTIRPMGEDRVEIILPSGSIKAQAAEEERFRQLIDAVRGHEEWKDELTGYAFQSTRTSVREMPIEIKRVVDKSRWERLLAALEAKYPNLKGKLAEVPPGEVAVLAERAKANGGQPTEADLKTFVESNYKPADLALVAQFVDERFPAGRDRRNLGSGDVQHIKNLISQQGSLEFNILANERDDDKAIKAAREYFANALNKRALEERAKEGLPPEAPRPPPGDEFTVRGERATYAWVEIGPPERQSLRLMNANEADGPGSRWAAAAAARERGELYVDAEMNRVVIYSRPVVNARLSEAQRQEKKFEYFFLCRTSDAVKVGGPVSITAFFTQDQRLNPAVGFRFNSTGGAQFHHITSSNLPDGEPKLFRHLAIILDREIVSAPSLRSAIDTNGIIEGAFTKEQVDRMVEILRSGALPATLKPTPASENLISPTLGQDTIEAGTKAVGWAFLAVLIFMCLYYRFAGFVASVALLANLLLTIGFMVMVNATFTLPGLAGLVLMLGMAVDANVLIYERLREERDRGASLAMAIRNGYDRAFPTIIDTHLSSIFTAIVLYAVGNDQLKGFGVSLTAGLVISLFTSLYMTRLMFDIWLARGWLKKLSMFRFFTRPNIDFMRIRYYWFTATAILTVLGLALFLYRDKDGLNIDFTGGTSVSVRLKEPRSISDVRDFFDRDRQKKLLEVTAAVQKDEEGRQFEVTYSDGKTVPIQLHDRAPGDTQQEREASVRQRAGQLPNWSVEQIFASGAPGAAQGLSDLFTVRTSEKERVLVLTAVNRLVSENGVPALQQARAVLATNLDQPKLPDDWRRAVQVRIDPPEGVSPAEFRGASPEYLRSVLAEALQNAGVKDQHIAVTVTGEGQNRDGHFTQMTVNLAATTLNAYPDDALKSALRQAVVAFNARPQPEKLENFDAALAQETRNKAYVAILLSWAAILLYLWFRFGSWTFGAAAVICLIHDLCFTLGIIAACHYVVAWFPGLATVLGLDDFKIDLQTVAALLTLVGYSVNDTIVVFDRIREVRGKNPLLTPQMINDSVNQTLSRTILAATTVWLVVLVLYIFGGAGLHLFSFVMVVGVLIGTYSSIYVASPMLLLLGEGKPPTPVRETRPAPAPQPA